MKKTIKNFLTKFFHLFSKRGRQIEGFGFYCGCDYCRRELESYARLLEQDILEFNSFYATEIKEAAKIRKILEETKKGIL